MQASPRFRDRQEAGRVLAGRLHEYAHRPDVMVLALPRGGVPVAAEVAAALDAPLDVFVVRKLGVPGQEEYAMGAIASGGVTVLNDQTIAAMNIQQREIDAIIARETAELARREALYRERVAAPDVRGRVVILVDDGLATGSTMQAAATALRKMEPARIVVAVPVAAPQACAVLDHVADECITALTPDPFYGVGLWYDDFTQTSDAEVRALLQAARNRTAAASATS
jgi:predicted phosphoribosyltransferase